ncbi:MAG: alpha-hydroxy-acid oxidizing protein [Proteobacteria bacterium]|nr:alpha-hydroxy-acid oxidizing protein [Pseudomonadota bacterium]
MAASTDANTDADPVAIGDAINIMDFARLARERMNPPSWEYYASGADDEVTLRANRDALARIALHYRVLVDVSQRSLATRVVGQEISMPLIIGPAGFHKLAHPDGEVATASAAGRAGTVMVLSTMSNTPVEDVMVRATGPIWFQLYVYRDRGITRGLVERVEAAGCSALVLTVDVPLLGRRERDVRNRFTLPEGLTAANLLPAGLQDVQRPVDGSSLAAYASELFEPALTWQDIDWLRSITRLPIVVKGIVRPDDARRAVDHGAAGIVVSNHGGRQLDTAPATIDVLGRIAADVASDTELMVDGGFRRGTDVLKAIALGARAVLIAQPALWGLAVGGADGVSRVLELFRAEIDLAMGLCGCPTIADIGPDLLDGGAGNAGAGDPGSLE